jgi:2-keto-3-deoxy-L-rhamnonate aldolase RhmA
LRNLVKHKLKAGKPAIGTWVSIGHPDVTMYLADMGFDWLVCDMEHSAYGPERARILNHFSLAIEQLVF